MTATLPIPALLPTYAPYPFPLVRGEGDRVFDDRGQGWWDFYGGHCVCATGHSHPAVVKAVADQAASLLFYSAAAALPVRDQAAVRITAFAGCFSSFANTSDKWAPVGSTPGLGSSAATSCKPSQFSR